MRALALIGLLLSLVLAGLAAFETAESVEHRRVAQDHELQGAVAGVATRVLGSERQMTTVAAQMLVNPEIAGLLRDPAAPRVQRMRAVADAERALASFEASAIVPVSSACIDDAAGAQLACGPRAGGVVFPPDLRARFRFLAGLSPTGLPTGGFRSPVTGRRTGSFLVPLRIGGRFAGLVHFDMSSSTVHGNSVLAHDVPGVRLLLMPEAMRDPGGATWPTLVGGHRALVTELPIPIAHTGLALSIVGVATASNPTWLNATGPGVLATLALAAFMLVGSIVVLLAYGRRIARELATDPLTRLRNRRALMEELPRVCQRATEEDPAFLWFFDLNGFKAYNDAFGHLAGDVLLTRLGQRLRSTVGAAGTVYRLDGDEFCVLVTARVSDPHALFQRARAALREQGGAFTVTASAGAVEIPREAYEPQQAMRIADQHMYRDKAANRAGAAELITAVLHAALAQRHPELDEHSSDVACDVELLARAVGLDDEAVEMIIRAGDLHDVGKLGIPDEIITNPGPLSEREWEFMRQHTVMGERIIAAAGPSLERIAPLVRASHERWDGAGYPDGLAGEQIPLGARIITICDSYRAMLSERPYKSAMPVEDALAELSRCAGTQFDPQLVEVFCRLVREQPAGAPSAPSAPRAPSAPSAGSA
jgi:diguanylate cyclase (GGDEF)-like protein